MRLLIWSIFLVVAWKWGDWRNWRKYEGAIYYNIVFSYIYTLLTIHYPLWMFQKDESLPFLSNHVLVSIAYGFVIFTTTNLIYLGRFPNGKTKGVLWVLLFVVILSSIEFFVVKNGRMTYDNGWSQLHTIIFNVLMLSAVRMYITRPFLTLSLSLFFTVFYCYLFNVPIHKLP